MSGDIGRITTSYYHENRNRCPCCNRPPDRGRLLPCLHTVCTPCLSKAEMILRKLDKRKRMHRGSPLASPSCCRSMGPLGWFLCPLCHSSHLVTRLGTNQLPLANNNILQTEEGKYPPTTTSSNCSLHSLANNVFCHSCNMLICSACRANAHPAHQVQDIDPLSKGLVNVLSDAVNEIRERVKVIDSNILQIRSIRKVGPEKRSFRKEVMSMYEGYVNRVRHTKKIPEETQENYQEESVLLTEELKLVQYKADLESLCYQISEILNKNEKTEVVRLMVPLAKRLDKISEKIFATGEVLSKNRDCVIKEEKGPDLPAVQAGWSVDPTKSHLRLDSNLYEKVVCSLPLVLADSKGMKLDIYRNIDIKAVMTLYCSNENKKTISVSSCRSPEGGGEWRLRFSAPEAGIAKLSVAINDQDIKNSPYILQIRELELDPDYLSDLSVSSAPVPRKFKTLSSGSYKETEYL